MTKLHRDFENILFHYHYCYYYFYYKKSIFILSTLSYQELFSWTCDRFMKLYWLSSNHLSIFIRKDQIITRHFLNQSKYWIWNNRLEIIGFNNSNQIRKLLRHAPCVVYTLNLYGYKKKLLYILYFRLFLSHRKFVCCFTHKKNKSSKKSFVSFLFISIFATNMYNRKPHKLSFCAFQSIYPT